MVGYGVDYHAPRPPFILAKLFWRSPFALPFQVLWFCVSLFGRLLAGVVGLGGGTESIAKKEVRWVFTEAGARGYDWRNDAAIGSDEFL